MLVVGVMPGSTPQFPHMPVSAECGEFIIVASHSQAMMVVCTKEVASRVMSLAKLRGRLRLVATSLRPQGVLFRGYDGHDGASQAA